MSGPTVKPPEVMHIIEAARAAGLGLMADFARLGDGSVQVQEKGPSDFVSSADLRSQETLQAALSRSFPGHEILTEEGAHEAENIARTRLIVDPLDGTTNFLRGVPHFAISIALEVGGVVTAGVVLDVPKGELFWAAKGHGAWLGDGLREKRLAVSNERDLGRVVVGTGIPHRGRGEHASYLESLARVMREVAGVRRFGAAALDLAYVAAGRMDAFFELGLAPWDVAAGTLLVEEAGGKVTRCDGERTGLTSRDVLATSGEPLHAQIVGMLLPMHGRPARD